MAKRGSLLRVINRVGKSLSRKGGFANINVSEVQRDHRDKQFKILMDGPKNDFIDHLSRLISSSPITTACLREKLLFVKGKGFNDNLGDIRVNEKQTLRELHELVVSDYVNFGRVCIKVIADKAGRNKLELHHIPVEWARWNIGEDTEEIQNVVLNPFFNTPDEKAMHNQYYPIYFRGIDNDFSPSFRREFEEGLGKEIEQEYKGHILFYNKPNPHNRHYSRPDFYSTEDWIVTDYRIGQFHERNTANNFLLGGILHIPGNPDDPIYGDDEETPITTKGEEAEDRLKEWFAGTSEAGSILLAFFNDPDQKWEFEPFQVGNSYEVVKGLTEDVTKIISMVHGVPETLLQNTAGKLGSSSEIKDAKELLKDRTANDIEILESLYTDLLTGFNGATLPEEGVKITALEIAPEMPSEVFGALSTDAKNRHIEKNYGLEDAVEEVEVTEIIEEDGSDNIITE